MNEKHYNIEIKEKPNSFEVGVASKRHKIYYGEISELKERLLGLIDLGLIDAELVDINLEKLK